jgi:hypothetical protein
LTQEGRGGQRSGGWRARDRETSPFKDERRRVEVELTRKR